MFHILNKQVIGEILQVLDAISHEEVDTLIDAISRAQKIVTCGAGRMGMMAKAFAMRLSHLGKEAYNISDCNTPKIGAGDLLIVCSGSGETRTILSLVESARNHQAEVALISTRKASSMAALSNLLVVLPAPNKILAPHAMQTIQPMTTLTEQSCLLFFDTVVLMLMKRLQKTHDMLKERHSILE